MEEEDEYYEGGGGEGTGRTTEKGFDREEDEEEEEEEEQYEYEEDYRSTLASIPRSKTDWEVFKGLGPPDADSVEDQPYSSASPPSSPEAEEEEEVASRRDLQAEAALALTNCHKIARRKFQILKQKEVESEENKLEKLLGRKIPRDEATGRFTVESLCHLNTPTLQVIVNDLHSKIERLNEHLVLQVIEKDELQVVYRVRHTKWLFHRTF